MTGRKFAVDSCESIFGAPDAEGDRRLPPPERVRPNVDTAGTPSPTCMTTLDVREIPPVDRHPTIHDAFDALEPGETLTIVNDHEPKPLFYEFQAEVGSFDADGYTVEQVETAKFVAEFPKREA